MDNTKQAYVQGTLGTDSFICDRDKALEKLEILNKIIEDLRGYIASDMQNDLAAFHDIKGFIGGTEVKEDNLFYDINVEGVYEESGKGEHYDDTFVGYPDAVANTLEGIANKIKDHIDAYEYYSNRTDFPEFVRKMMERLKGSKIDLKLTLDDLTTCTREELLEKYGITAEDIAKNPDEMEFASEEEKNAYLEALAYLNEELGEDQRHYSVGKAEDYAKTLALASVVETVAAKSTDSTDTLDYSKKDGNNGDTTKTQATSESAQANKEASSSTNSTSSGSSSGVTSSGGGSSSGQSTPRRTTNIPATSDVEKASMEEHQNEMKEATNKSVNTKAFEERNTYEEKIANEQKAQEDANKSQEAKEEANHAAKLAEETNKSTTQTTETKPTTENNTSTEESTSTAVEANPTTTETVSQTTETPPVQPLENIAPAPTAQPAAEPTQTTQAAPAVTATVPEIKDMISNGKTAPITTTQADSSKMVSSVTSNSTPLKPITIENKTTTKEPTSTVGKFVPPIAGVSTAAVAGLGAKLYMDKSNEKEEDKDKKKENKFFDENIQQEDDSKLNFSSKEDIIKLLDR